MLFNFRKNWRRLDTGDSIVVTNKNDLDFTKGRRLSKGYETRWPVVRKEDGRIVMCRDGKEIDCNDDLCDLDGIRTLPSDSQLPSGAIFQFFIDFKDGRDVVGTYSFSVHKEGDRLIVNGGADQIDGVLITGSKNRENLFFNVADAYATMLQIKLPWWKKLLLRLL